MQSTDVNVDCHFLERRIVEEWDRIIGSPIEYLCAVLLPLFAQISRIVFPRLRHSYLYLFTHLFTCALLHAHILLYATCFTTSEHIFSEGISYGNFLFGDVFSSNLLLNGLSDWSNNLSLYSLFRNYFFYIGLYFSFICCFRLSL